MQRTRTDAAALTPHEGANCVVARCFVCLSFVLLFMYVIDAPHFRNIVASAIHFEFPRPQGIIILAAVAQNTRFIPPLSASSHVIIENHYVTTKSKVLINKGLCAVSNSIKLTFHTQNEG